MPHFAVLRKPLSPGKTPQAALHPAVRVHEPATLREAIGLVIDPGTQGSRQKGARNISVSDRRIRIIDPDPDPLQETLIWIRVPKKIVINSHTKIKSHTNQLKL